MPVPETTETTEEQQPITVADGASGVPSPGEIARQFLGDDASPKPNAEVKPDAPAKDEGDAGVTISREEHKKLLERIEAAEKERETAQQRQQHTRDEYQRTQHELSLAQRVADQIAQRRQQELAYFEHMKQMAPPEIAEPEKLFDDPKLLASTIAQNRDYALTAMRGEFGPVLQAMAQQLEELRSQQTTLRPMAERAAQASAIAQAREEVTKEGYDDFDEMLPKIRETLVAHNAAGALNDPDALANAYYLARRATGKPMRSAPVPEKRTAPQLAPTNGSVNGRKRGIDPALLSRINPMVAEMQRAFHDPDFKPTLEDLEAVGLVGGS